MLIFNYIWTLLTLFSFIFFPLQLKINSFPIQFLSNSLDDTIVFDSIAENLSFEVANK